MTSAADLVPDPWALLRAGYLAWTDSPAWTVTQVRGGVASVLAAVRPGLQWISDWQGHDGSDGAPLPLAFQVLVR